MNRTFEERLWKCLVAGLGTGYIVTLLQQTDGPGNVIRTMREAFRKACDKAPNKFLKSYKTLSWCPWCLSPYVGFLMWLLFARESGLLGLIGIVSVGGYYNKS